MGNQIDIFDYLKYTKIPKELFDYENLTMPPWQYYISPEDVAIINNAVTSAKLSGKPKVRRSIMDEVMNRNGFVKLGGGTNRIVYRHYEDTSIVAKVAVDKVGMGDNPAEFKTQNLLKPFCAKMLQVTPCGTIGFAERVVPIRNRDEFDMVADDICDLLYYMLDGRIMEDVGCRFMFNWGVRPGMGPVLLDYPYVYEVDYNKLTCRNTLRNGSVCNGFIDYDKGFDFLTCQKCGRRYEAINLRKQHKVNPVVITKGGSLPMKISIKRGDEIIKTFNESDTIAATRKSPSPYDDSTPKFKTRVTINGVVVRSTYPEDNQPPVHMGDKVVELAPSGTEPGTLVPRNGDKIEEVKVEEVSLDAVIDDDIFVEEDDGILADMIGDIDDEDDEVEIDPIDEKVDEKEEDTDGSLVTPYYITPPDKEVINKEVEGKPTSVIRTNKPTTKTVTIASPFFNKGE